MSAPPAIRPDTPAAGIGLILVALLSFTAMDTAIKAAVQNLPVLQILWARFVFHLIVVSILLAALGRRVPPRTRAPGLQIIRSLCLAAANLSFSTAIKYVPLAEAVAIGFVSPLVTVLLASRILGETVGWRRWLGIGVGFAGVIVIIRPGLGVTHPAAFLVLVTAVLFAAYSVLTRRLAGTDDAFTTIFHTGVAATVLTSAVVPFVWVTPTFGQWALMALIGTIGGGGHFLLIQAYQRAPASLLAPFHYSQIIWATLAGWLFFHELPDDVALMGSAIVALGGLFVIWTETRAKPVAPGPKPL